MTLRLSKSRFTAGTQCHKLLWWKVHEPLAVELQPGKVLQDRFDQGAHVGRWHVSRFPGHARGLAAPTRTPTASNSPQTHRRRRPAIFEASFLADNTFVAVDVLAPQDGGYHLTE